MKSLLNDIQNTLAIEEQIRTGLQAETLRNNSAFIEALKKLHAHYGFLSDAVTAENGADADKHRHHYSLMRIMITDLANEIDILVTEGDNAESTKAQLNEQGD